MGMIIAGITGAAFGAFGAAQAGGKKRSAALGAEEYQHQQRQAAGDLRDYFRESGQPFYDIGLDVARTGQSGLAAFRDEALNPEVSPRFRLLAEEGLREIAGNYGAAGSPSSGAAQVASGRFMAGLAADERNRQTENLYRLAGLSQQALPFVQSLNQAQLGALGEEGAARRAAGNFKQAYGAAAAEQIQGYYGAAQSGLGAIVGGVFGG